MKLKSLLLILFISVMRIVQAQTVVDVIVNSPDHNTLEAAVVAANLQGTLSGAGPFTVFAPTDAAFAALPAGTVEALLQDPQGALTNILLNLVAGATVLSSDLRDGQAVVTLNSGKTVKVTINTNGVFIDDAQVTVADVVASNGVVHVINAVLLPPNTVVDVIVGSADHNTLEAAVGAAGLVNTLNGAGPFTVFAPTDAAFAALPAGTVEALLQDPQGLLTNILLNHVAGASVLSSGLTDGQAIVTLNSGKTVKVTINTNGVFIDDAQVTVADIVTDNGVVHVIDAVLLPPNTVVDVIVGSADHNTLEAAVGAAGLVNTLNGAGPFTVFAPTDAAFAALPAGTVEALLQDPQGLLTNILLNHVAGASVLSSGLTDGQAIVTLNSGKTVKVAINANGVFIDDAQVTVADIVTDNGVVHVIDAVLLPPNTVVDVIVGSADHNTLEAAVGAAGLVNTLNGAGPFTVFAPTDAAFAALPAGTVEALLQDPQGLLTNILLNHVAGASVLSSGLTDGQAIVTLNNGKTVKVAINANGVFIDDAQVTVADIVTDNGVVHVIDAVLLPPNTVVDVIVGSADHNTLEAAVGAAGLVNTLNGAGPFTVFAPTDAAFAALPAGTVEALLNDIPALTSILTYHVVGASALSSDLSDGQVITTLNGSDVTVTINDDGVFINNAQVTVVDITTDNGVVHVINAVLIPNESTNTVFDIIKNSADHTTLELAIIASGLNEPLSDLEESYTVFAPTDAAFSALPEGTVEALLADPQGALADVLLYHVTEGRLPSSEIINFINEGPYALMLNNKLVTFRITDDGVFINNAKITVVDLEADNGIVHVIDAVILAPDSTIIDVVRNSSVHSTLESLLDLSGLSDPLEGYGPFTLFAPTDDAINALGTEVIDQVLNNEELLTEILAYHVVGGLALSSDLSDGQLISTLLEQNVKVTINADGVFINNAKVIVADIVTDNGVVHVIDAVLLPEEESNTVFDIIQNSPDHNLLETAIIVAELDDDLSSEGPFTVFAPTDEAFEALPAGTIESLLGNIPALTSILTYHVVGASAFSTDLADGQVITTLNGKDVTVSISANGLFINDAQVIISDLIGDNGVVHVIDAVLLPPSDRNTILDIIVNSPDHNTLEAAVLAAGLDGALTSDGPFTVFAPTDDAFAALPAGTVEALLNDIPALTSILTYHAVIGEALSTDLANGQKIATLNGADVTVTINANGVFINNAKVTVADIIADNGVVHVIDAVLLPPPSSSNDVDNTLALQVTPNPAVDKLKVDIVNSDAFAEILEIVNIQGKSFISVSNISLNEHIDISQLPSGVYMLKVGTKEGMSVRKFVKQ
jgi:transforming growth factor-beta-induced protein